ncbi:BrnT family toxin [Treponema sp. TIM-1]|uniref:BrnT family toxin n=1 Tax=Treponema sp. TIM-1 TaxID=2898417 RepID=UPI00397F6FB9
MNYEWDTAKNLENIRKHKVSFEQAVSAIEDPHRLFLYDEVHSQNEDRYIVIGYTEGLVLFVNEVEIDEDTIRIISARTANKREEEAYYGNCALYFGNRS